MVPAQEQGLWGTSQPPGSIPQALGRKVGWKGRAGRRGGREAGGGREEEWEGREREGGSGGVLQTQNRKTLGKPCPLILVEGLSGV